MTDTGGLRVDGTVSATALEYTENGTTKDVATELATLRSMVGSSGVSVAGMLVASYMQYTYNVSLQQGSAPSQIYRPTTDYQKNSENWSNWVRYISGGQVFESTLRYSVTDTKDSTPSDYKYTIQSTSIPESVLSSIAESLVIGYSKTSGVAGSFVVTCNFYAAQASSSTYFASGNLAIRNGSFAGFTKNNSGAYYDTLYSDNSNSIVIYADFDNLKMKPLEE